MSDKRTNQADEEQRRDEMLKRLLKTPPQPRPKRERDEKKKPKCGDGRRTQT